MVDEIERARSAMQSLSPDVGRAEWVKIGMAAHAAGLSLQDFMEFSRPGATFNESACKATWRSFKGNQASGVSAATLFALARAVGWTDGDVQANPPPPRPAKAATKPVDPPRKPAPGMSASEVWGRALPLEMPTHPYLVRKKAAGVPLNDLRVLSPQDNGLVIAGQNMDGALVVPAATIDGALQSLQLIPPQGKKMNLPGCPISGALHVVGELVAGGVAYVCEGVGQAWACWQSTGAAAICAFGWGNVARVAGILRQKDKSARICIVPDVGKESEARTIAARLGCSVAELPPGLPGNTDINDYAQSAGIDVVQDLLEAALNTQHAPDGADSQDNFDEPQEKPLALDMVSVSDVLTNPSPPPVFVWAGYLPRGVVSLFGAHGGTGKSTIALMLATAAALGRPLFGVDTVQCKTLFFSAEDNGAIVRHRLATICRAWQINPADLAGQLQIVDGTENPELFTADARAAGDTTSTYSALLSLVQAEGFGLVIADNASDTFGGDEINRRQVRAFMRALNRLATVSNCAVLLLAHVDKSTSRNGKGAGGEAYSGSTAWHNSARSRLFMARSESGTLEIAHQKSNFGRMQAPLLLQWHDGGLPMLAEGGAVDFSGLMAQAQGRSDDNAAAALLKLIAEFEGRGQYCHTGTTSRSNPFAVLKVEPAFKALGIGQDDTKRILNQCHRAKWVEPLEYRTKDRKLHERWTVTESGRLYAGLPATAPTAPTAPTDIVGTPE